MELVPPATAAPAAARILVIFVQARHAAGNCFTTTFKLLNNFLFYRFNSHFFRSAAALSLVICTLEFRVAHPPSGQPARSLVVVVYSPRPIRPPNLAAICSHSAQPLSSAWVSLAATQRSIPPHMLRRIFLQALLGGARRASRETHAADRAAACLHRPAFESRASFPPFS